MPPARPAKNNLRCAPSLSQIHPPCSSSRTAHAKNHKLILFYLSSEMSRLPGNFKLQAGPIIRLHVVLFQTILRFLRIRW